MATVPSEIISGLRTRCYYFPWVFECTSVYTVYTVYLLLCCLWSHGNPPMHNVINVSAMKFLSNWLWIKKFTLRNFTLAERDNSEKKITIWEGHDVEKYWFFFKILQNHMFLYDFTLFWGISLKILKSHHHRTKKISMKNHPMKKFFLLVKKCSQKLPLCNVCATGS